MSLADIITNRNFFYIYYMSVLDTLIAFIPPIYIYMACYKKRNGYKLRTLLSTAVYLVLGVIAPVLIFYFAQYANVYFLSAAYFVLYVMLFLGIFCIYDISIKSALFAFIVCYSYKLLAEIFFNFIVEFTVVGTLFDFSRFELIFAYYIIKYATTGVIYTALYFIFFRKHRFQITPYAPNGIIVAFCTIITVATLVLDDGSKTADRDWYYHVSYTIICVACYLLILVIQSGLLERSNLTKEIDIKTQIWKEKEKQLLISRENAELISIKYHDLKHQINALRKNADIPNDELKKINDAITQYNSLIKTGNDTLDAVLTDKYLFCESKNIAFTCIADGGKLNFMPSIEIVALFGNAIENAIDAVMQLDEENRFIDLKVFETKGFIFINAANPYAGEIKMSGDLPITTKGSSDFHGFGVKSIKNIVHEHGGAMNITADDNIFSLKITIPVPPDK